MEQNFSNSGFNVSQLQQQFLNLLQSLDFCTPEGKRYKINVDKTFLNMMKMYSCIQLIENEKVEAKREQEKLEQPKQEKTKLDEIPQIGGYSEINTLNSIFGQNLMQQGGNNNIFSSTSNMFNGFQNGGYVNATTTSTNQELDLSIFSQLESKPKFNQHGGDLSTLASVFD